MSSWDVPVAVALIWCAVAALIGILALIAVALWVDRPTRARRLERQVERAVGAPIDWSLSCAVRTCTSPWTHSTHGWTTCDEHTPDWDQIQAVDENDDLAVADLALWEIEAGRDA